MSLLFRFYRPLPVFRGTFNTDGTDDIAEFMTADGAYFMTADGQYFGARA